MAIVRIEAQDLDVKRMLQACAEFGIDHIRGRASVNATQPPPSEAAR
jgi:hypothetical protein